MPVNSSVTRFHTLPAKGSGQSFVVLSTTGTNSLEFNTYAALVAAHLQTYGWTQSASESADYTVNFAANMGESRQEHGSLPIMGQTGGGTTYHSGSVNTYGSYGSTRGTYSGTSYTPATFGVVGSMPYSVTFHDSFLNLRIRDQKDQAVFEGRVAATGRNSELSVALPAMIDALFTGFPGESGKTKQISKAAR
ncbi:DUF4136 domain-containing protein [Luteolibacter sp. GHJ8]|uniref:DUF4136 domain-containing protein n=2 Tax=Luteolibacter rhizosphaerae TaxID=2989719 RepID=A0ABT3G3A8_9BACT|nr:DUF4136 domain-containing protein [Luteolibacter rhizosphaerae]